MENRVEVSLVIPAYNEEQRLSATLDKIIDYLRAHQDGFEVIVVDDGSSDATSSIVREYMERYPQVSLLSNDKNTGKGFSVKKGVLASRGEYILFSDADLSTPIEEAEKLLRSLKDSCDVAFASRAMPDSQIIRREAWYRDAMGKIFGLLVRNIALPGVRDSQCGFKGFRREVIPALFNLQKLKGFAFDVEILFIARKLGLAMKEVAVRWIDSPKSKVNPMIDSCKMLGELCALRWNDFCGRYSAK